MEAEVIRCLPDTVDPRGPMRTAFVVPCSWLKYIDELDARFGVKDDFDASRRIDPPAPTLLQCFSLRRRAVRSFDLRFGAAKADALGGGIPKGGWTASAYYHHSPGLFKRAQAEVRPVVYRTRGSV